MGARSERHRTIETHSLLPALLIAIAVAVLHLLTNSRYGFHRDELQFLSDARHLEWGFVPYPPLTPAIEHVSLALFGLSLNGLRLFSVLAQSIAIFLTGLMARDLGASRFCQAVAAVAVALSPLPLFNGTEFQYTSFDFLWWVVLAWCAICLLRSEDGRWWLAIGCVMGVALLTKYSVAYWILGVIGGILFTPSRRWFVHRWFWAGMGIALLLFLPNLLWEARHQWISLTFLQFIHARDVRLGRTSGFWPDQFVVCTNPVTVPLWITGLVWLLRNQRYRTLAWMYLISIVLFVVSRGRGYYMAGAYPMLMAAGAGAAERWLHSLSLVWRRAIEVAFLTAVLAAGAYICARVLPIASSGPLMHFALDRSSDLREEIGWDDLVRTVAGIRDSIPADQRSRVGIIVGNYGEQGAIEILGSQYGLPAPISGTNSAWLRGYSGPIPTTFIVLGYSREDVDKSLSGCRLAAQITNRFGVSNEESRRHPDIFVCGAPKKPWDEIWRRLQRFGYWHERLKDVLDAFSDTPDDLSGALACIDRDIFAGAACAFRRITDGVDRV
jgi:hypothetical protein